MAGLGIFLLILCGGSLVLLGLYAIYNALLGSAAHRDARKRNARQYVSEDWTPWWTGRDGE